MKGEISDDVKQAARVLRAEGLSIRKIAGQLGIGVGSTHRIVKDVKPEKAPGKAKEKVEEKVESALPSAYDKFCELGASVGVEEPLLSATSDFVFRMGADNVKAVFDNLKGIIRVDLARSWAKLYGGYLGQELRVETEFGGDSERFSVVGSSLVKDPDGVTHTQALRELELRLRAAQPDSKSPLDEVERIASLVTSLKSVFGGNSQGSQGSIIQLKDGTLSLADFLSLKTFEVDSHARVESDKRKMEIAEGFKDLLTQASSAFKHISEEE